MQVMWAPWRMVYLVADQPPECIFCPAGAQNRRAALILSESAQTVTMLNKFPYTSGHVMVAPRRHVADPAALPDADFIALMRALHLAIGIVREEFQPDGMNVGLNLGRAAGAGIDAHLHWHVVPRWNGDTNFMPMLADTRVMPEHLEATFDRLQPRFAGAAGPSPP